MLLSANQTDQQLRRPTERTSAYASQSADAKVSEQTTGQIPIPVTFTQSLIQRAAEASKKTIGEISAGQIEDQPESQTDESPT